MAVFLFPGQGAQFSGMGVDLWEADADGKLGVRSLFETADAILGADTLDLLNSDAETLKRTDVSQSAITIASLAAVRVLAARGILPSACAGFSLGEYPALVVAGVISVADAILLTKKRGEIMQEICSSITNAGMAAVLGLSPEKVDEVIASSGIADLYGANYNSPTQTVVSGTASALTAAEEAFKAAGARRVIRLKVAGPFHSSLMAAAGERFAAVLDGIGFNDPVLPLFSNVTGARVTSGAEAKRCAVSHISNPVRWTTEEAAIAAFLSGVPSTEPALIEAGPGKVLSGLWADSGNAGSCMPYADVLAGMSKN